MTRINARVFIFGFILWLIPFVLAIPLFQFIGSNRVVFKSIMSVILVITTCGCWIFYIKKIDTSFLRHALTASLVWVCLSVIPDLFAFIVGFKMKPSVYFSEIALNYLAIPTILVSSAWVLETKTS
jgi:hypothetical protein